MIYPSKKITVGSRESPLAKAQVKVFLNVLSNKFGVSSLKFIKSKFLKTSGDIGFFVSIRVSTNILRK